MTPKSLDRLTHVHPILASKVKAICTMYDDHGATLEVVQGLRTFAEQDALFAQGRTTPGKRVTNARGGQSNHNYGLAVDLCPFLAGQPRWTWDEGFNEIGELALKVGLEWGGSWHNLVDKPHVQIANFPLSLCQSLYKQGGLVKVWAVVTESLT